MCGICGVVGGDRERERAQVAAMNAALAHRGPDDAGVHASDDVVLGNRRLAILDLSAAGHQPLGSGDLGAWITYNGEIYNYRELRDSLERDHHVFRSGTDTEVLLALYLRDGRACLDRLRGMFAFAIWDARDRRLFAARDHFGQKPFYYAVRGERLLFASEIKALLAHADVSAEPEPAAIDYYLSLRVIPPPLTMYRGIHKLPAGHWLEWSREGGLRTGRYWEPRFDVEPARRDEDWIEELRARLEESVQAHRVSDVPVGAFLSGGLDSSVVVAALTRHGREPVPTFCIGSEVPAFDERPHAALMAGHCGTTHHEVAVSAGLLDRLPGLVRALDEPSDPISACFDEAARLAARHVKVALGGDGGDEMFAGFDRYAAFRLADRYAALPRWLRQDVIGRVVRSAPEGFGYKSFTQRARWLDSVAAERGGRLYARMTSHFRFGPEYRATLYGPALRDALANADALEAIASPFDRAPVTSPLDRMIYADLMTRLPEHTLMLADRLAMAHGLEVRSPLLDVRLAELCLAMPARLRIRRGVTKYALRQAARPWLPPALLRRGKQGFMFPVAHWLHGAAIERVRARLLGGPLVRDGWIQASSVEAVVAEHASRRADHHVRIWQLASLDAWHRLYLGGSAADLEEQVWPASAGRGLGSAQPERSMRAAQPMSATGERESV
jgi:asparagine synthase (glutamine-hydrolysing)